MSAELVPYGCDMPMWHGAQTVGAEEIHVWHVAGVYGSITLRAVCLPLCPILLPSASRDINGALWLADGLVFHGVAPQLGEDHYEQCPFTFAECWATFASRQRAVAMVNLAVRYALDRDTYIHRALTAEYHLAVAESLLAVNDPVGVLSW